MKKKTVLIGLLGSTLDQGKKADRWQRWRPSVAVNQHEDLLIHRFELLYQEKNAALATLIKQDLGSVAPETRVNLHQINFPDPWDFEPVYNALYSFARQYDFREDEDYLVHITTGTHVAQICLYLLTEARYFPARLIQTSPGRRNQKRYEGSYRLIDLDLSKYDKIASRFQIEQEESISFLKSGIETRNSQFNALIEKIERVSIRSKSCILLMGPTGAGKTQLARRIYQLKKLKRQIIGEYVEVNCATLRGDSAMSSLFGHKKGAFTGAQQERAGLLKKANEGLLFLDEIGELGLDEQAMLLHALEEKRFYPVGSDQEVQSDFQLLIGTNRDLKQAVSRGSFRQDLLARISLWRFSLPGLKERLEDIGPNIDYELGKYAREHNHQISFNREAKRRYLEFASSSMAAWKDNFRDLNSSINRMATLCDGARINEAVVEQEIHYLQLLWRSPEEDFAGVASLLDQQNYEKLDLFTKVQLSAVIKCCHESNSLADAGRKLFSHSRLQKSKANDSDRLRKYLAKFDLSWSDLSN